LQDNTSAERFRGVTSPVVSIARHCGQTTAALDAASSPLD